MPANDDIDDILRAAMKTLDGETPSGYFEDLPKRTLARLEGMTMQTTSETESSSSNNELPMSDDSGKVRDEDSGLHDIRNLAATSRSRMSSRRLGTTPPSVDEDILASASGSWKSIALPEPARMISLPEMAELTERPSQKDLKAQEKASKLAAKAEAKVRKSRPSGQMETMPELAAPIAAIVPEPKIAEAPLHLEAPVASDTAKGAVTAAVGTAKGASIASVTPMIGARIAAQSRSNKSNKGLLIGLAGVGLAAAAGVAIYLGTRGEDKPATQAAASDDGALRAKTEPTKPTAAPIEPAPVAVAKEEPKEEPTVVEPEIPVEPPTNAKTVKPAKPTVGKKPEKTKIEVQDPGNGVKAPVKKEEPKKEPPKEGDPDFEQLLKDSGYQKKDSEKPKLEKKSLAAGDFKAGMAGVSSSAQGCYKGTQGTAMVKLTIAPSGKVSKVSVTGVGAAEASCVQAAVQGASFPAWEGGPQTFNYSYLLSN